jgi:hypothetical protein
LRIQPGNNNNNNENESEHIPCNLIEPEQQSESEIEFAALSAISAINACLVALTLEPMNLHGKSLHHRANYGININMARVARKLYIEDGIFAIPKPKLGKTLDARCRCSSGSGYDSRILPRRRAQSSSV